MTSSPRSPLALSFPLVACLMGAACSQTAARSPTGVDTSGSAGTSGAAGTGAAGTGTAGTGAAGTGAAGTGAAGDGEAGGTSGGAGGSAGAGGSSAGTGGHDAGATDARPTADASDGAAAGGCTAALCESFAGVEPGKPGSPWTLDVDTKGTVLETVADKGRKDTHSLHVKMSAMAGVHGYITETQTLATTGASFWGRVYIWYAVDTPGVHIVNVAVDGKMANGMSEQVRIVNVIGSHIATNRRSDDMGKGSNVGPDQGKWGCYEWHLTPQSLDVYLDGTMLPISETWTMPTLSLLRIGFERFTMGAAGDLWYDDVAVNDSRIGCD
jgi:hypothetical protein